MKPLYMAILSGLCCLAARAEDWTTKDGKTFKNVTVISHDTKVVTINSADGSATFPISLLSNQLQKRVNEDNVTAKDWTTTDGKTYTNVQIVKHDETSVTIIDRDGGAVIPLQNLPTDLQKEFGYDPAKVEAAAREKAVQQKAAIQTQQEAKRAAALEYLRENTKSIKEVETDQAGFVGKRFFIKGTIELDTYYNFGYADCSITHYSFCIRQNDHRAFAYLPKDAPIAEQLRKKLLASDDPIDGFFTVEIEPSRFDRNCETLMVLLVDYSSSEEEAVTNALVPASSDQTSSDQSASSSSPKVDDFNPGSINQPVRY